MYICIYVLVTLYLGILFLRRLFLVLLHAEYNLNRYQTAPDSRVHRHMFFKYLIMVPNLLKCFAIARNVSEIFPNQRSRLTIVSYRINNIFPITVT